MKGSRSPPILRLPFLLAFRKETVTAIFFYHALSQLLRLDLATIGRQDVPPEDLLAKAVANGYKTGSDSVEYLYILIITSLI